MSETMFEDEDVVPRQVDWRLWRRILGHLKPYPRAVATMTGCGVILAAVEVSLPLVTARIIDAASGLQGEGKAAEIPWWGLLYGLMLAIFHEVTLLRVLPNKLLLVLVPHSDNCSSELLRL